MSFKSQNQPLATAAGAPGLFTQVGMAGTAAVITVSFIHPIDVVKVRNNANNDKQSREGTTVFCQCSRILSDHLHSCVL